MEEILDGNGLPEQLLDGDLERLQDCDGSVASTAGISMKSALMAVPMDLNGEVNPSASNGPSSQPPSRCGWNYVIGAPAITPMQNAEDQLLRHQATTQFNFAKQFSVQ